MTRRRIVIDGEELVADHHRLRERHAVALLLRKGYVYESDKQGWKLPCGKRDIDPLDDVALDAQEWGGALNSASWEAIDALHRHCPGSSITDEQRRAIFNGVKAAMRDVILHYLAKRYEQMVAGERPYQWQCPRCKAVNDKDQSYCENCGKDTNPAYRDDDDGETPKAG